MKGCPLKYLLDLNDSGTWGNDPTGEHDTVVLRSTDINLDGSWRIHDPAARHVSGVDKVRKRLAYGDIVVVKSSGSPAHLGKSAIVTEEVADISPCFANFVQRLRPSPSTDSRYIWYVLNSKWAADEMASLGNTTTGLRNLNGTIIGSIRIPVTHVSEQRAIADYLDNETGRIDALISKKRRMIELLEERWNRLRSSEILCGLDPVRGGGLVQRWEEMNLGVLIRLQRGHDLPRQVRIAGDVPVVSSGGVSGWHSTAIANGPGVVTGRYGTIGEVFFLSKPYWPLNTTLYVKEFRRNDPRWVYHLLASVPLDIDAQKSAVGGINRNIVGSLRVPRPPFSEQQAIASALDKAKAVSEQSRRTLEAQIDLLAERRQALITAAVSGELAAQGRVA